MNCFSEIFFSYLSQQKLMRKKFFCCKKILLILKSKNYGFEKTKRPRIKHC